MIDIKQALMIMARGIIADNYQAKKEAKTNLDEKAWNNYNLKKEGDIKSVNQIFETAGKDQDVSEEILYIKSMISASFADKNITNREKLNIKKMIKVSGLDETNQRFLISEFASPASIFEIANNELAKNKKTAKNIYFLSAATMGNINEKERKHLDKLAIKLNLTDEEKKEIENIAVEK
jgi:uncharacterized membrane protein YebE (DUF533 family)